MGKASDRAAGRVRLNKATVGRLELPEGKTEHTFYDEELTRFGLRLRAKGGRTWVVVYRDGLKTIRRNLGDANVVKPEEAREKAREELARVELGEDPAAARQKEKELSKITLAFLIGEYVSGHVEKKQKARTQLETKRHLNAHWKPLHSKPAHTITRRDVSKRLADIATENGPVAANRARSVLSALFGWARAQGYDLDTNPVQGTAKPGHEKPRERVLSGDELRAIWGATEKVTDYHTIVRLLLLTGQRREEIAAMLRSEIVTSAIAPSGSGPGGALLRLSGSRTKNAQPHDVPLSAPALAALARHPEPEPEEGAEGNAEKGKPRRRELVFGRGEGGYSGWSRSKARLDQDIALAHAKAAGREKPTEEDRPKAWTLHDLRRTMTTVMSEQGLAQPHIVEAVLNHVSGHKGGVAGVYNRATYAAEKRAALDAWAVWLMETVGEAEAETAAGNVVELKRRA